MRCHFQERRGHRGSGSARGRWRQRCSVGIPEEDDGRPANRAGPPISEEEAAGQAGPEGGEGERWATAGSRGGGREVGHDWVESRKWLDKIRSNFIWNLDFLANFGNLHKEIPKEF
jgi:hypothetical protein